mmetsp:Transcript_49519/g.80300  ORF Transcript_49519/g.80300 Transcript_49519/m.80300 type:complete len:441 (+) Transcript_49519:82-1404(+)
MASKPQLSRRGTVPSGMLGSAGVPSSTAPSVVAASMNLTKNLIGAGIFSLPSALLAGSVLPGLAAMIVVGSLCGSSFVLIAFLCQKLNCQTYRDVWCVAFGKRTAFFVDSCILTNGFFACVAYTILVADFLQKALDGLAGWQVQRSPLILVITVVFMLPLSHAKDLTALRYTSMMGLAIIASVFCYVVSDCLGHFEASTVNWQANAVRLDMGIFKTVAISTSAFQAHYNAPRIFGQLNYDLGAHARTVVASFGTAFLVYASFAVAGLGLFGDALMGNVLRNYNAKGNTAILLSWFGMAFAIIFTYPLVFTAARDSLVGSQVVLQRVLRANPVGGHIGITSSLVTLISLVACNITDVSSVTGMLGAIVGSCLCWIVPGAIYLKVAYGGGGPTGDLEKPLLENGKALISLKADPRLAGFCCFLIVVGAASMFEGIRSVLLKV